MQNKPAAVLALKDDVVFPESFLIFLDNVVKYTACMR